MNKESQVSKIHVELTGSFWATLAFLVVAFFLMQHKFYHSLRFQMEGFNTTEEIVTAIKEGNLWQRVGLFSLGGFAVVSLLRKARNSMQIDKVLASFIICFFACSIASIAWADDVILTLKRVVALVLFSLGAVAVAERFSVKQINFLVLFCCSLFLLFGFSSEVALGTFHPFQAGYRYCGTIDPNNGAWELAALVISATTLALRAVRFRRLLFSVAFAALIFLLLSRTRTSFAAMLLALGLCFILKSSKLRIVAFGLVLIGAFCLLYLLFGDSLISGAGEAILLGRRDETNLTLSGRIPVWIECLRYIAERPILGYGYNGFWTLQHTLRISGKVDDWGPIGVPSALNGYIDLVLSLGIIGIFAYILVFVFAIKTSIVLSKNDKDLNYIFVFIILTFYCFVMFTEPIFFRNNFVTFIVFTLLAKLGFYGLARPHFLTKRKL